MRAPSVTHRRECAAVFVSVGFVFLSLLESDAVAQYPQELGFEFVLVLIATERRRSRDRMGAQHHNVVRVGALQDRFDRFEPGHESLSLSLGDLPLGASDSFLEAAHTTRSASS